MTESTAAAAFMARFDGAVAGIQHNAKRDVGYTTTRFLVMVKELGGLEPPTTGSSASASTIGSPSCSLPDNPT